MWSSWVQLKKGNFKHSEILFQVHHLDVICLDMNEGFWKIVLWVKISQPCTGDIKPTLDRRVSADNLYESRGLAAFQSDKRDTSLEKQLCPSSYVIRIEMLLLCGIFAAGQFPASLMLVMDSHRDVCPAGTLKRRRPQHANQQLQGHSRQHRENYQMGQMRRW